MADAGLFIGWGPPVRGREAKGLEVYTPDLKAFREFAQKRYLASDLAKSWPPGMLDKLNAI